MKTSTLLLPLFGAVLLFGCKKESTPKSVEFNGSTLYFTSGKISKEVAWAEGYSVTGATSPTDGKTNTEMIVDSLGAGNYAAKLCADLVEDGKSDWYLPSIEEFKAIAAIQDKLPSDYTGTYWTSTERTAGGAEFWYIHYGSQYNDFKNYKYSCLCTRKD